MAKLTLTFKDRTLQVTPITDGETTIGRDPDSQIHIDSLAIAPRHAVIRIDSKGAWVRQVDPRYPVFVNNVKITERQLNHGDGIGVGKHLLYYTDELHHTPPASAHDEAGTATQAASPSLIDAGLQVLNGKNIGLIIPLRSAMTRLGKDSASSAVIARRRDGFFLSALTGGENIYVNKNAINDDSVQLQNGDTVKIDQNQMQFFLS
ncbi:FHA domain-containing protein [Methylococcus sp. EFPC2]|uniref:FHA domain-containing protein n=1 Tax=Methylococcus sp. EFPC2 TaxID=2812648 RepID=UPI001967C3B6|nr:FHA domain-containing protein [Methylococcus sp. EFPC2]QSA98547.1 FHA domain-containing protein [Methylococcus sp. EFPC2]